MGSSLSGEMYTLSPALKDVATTPSLGFTVNNCGENVVNAGEGNSEAR